MKIEELALKIKDFFIKNNLGLDTCIYYNNKCIKDCTEVIENVKGSRCVEYANDETITITFEGALYHLVNYGSMSLMNKFSKLLEKYGYYYELGYAWSMSLYEI